MTTTNQPTLLRSDRDGIATLTLNRPQQRNALTRALIAELHDALSKIAADKSVRVVVIAANGPAFCSGHDLRELRANTEPTFYDAVFGACSAMMLALVKLPQPAIPRAHATATPAGTQRVASCYLPVPARPAPS